MKRIYAEDINGEAAILFVDDNGKAVYVSDTAFDEPLTYEVAVRVDYSNFLDFDTAEEASANYSDGSHLIDYHEEDWAVIREF